MLRDCHTHLPEERHENINSSLWYTDIVAWAIKKLHPASIPKKDGFEPKDETLIYHRALRMSLWNKGTAQKEIETMLDAVIITTTSSDWSFSS